MIFAAWSAVKFRPIASTKSPSGSNHHISQFPSHQVSPTVRTHQIEVNTVIYEIILSFFHAARRAKIHPIRLAHIFNLLVRARQTNELGMKLFQILLEYRRRISCRIARNHHRQQNMPYLRNYLVVHQTHLVELVGADVRAVCEAKVHEGVFAQHVGGREDFAVLVDQCEGPAHFGFADAFGLVGDALAGDALFLVGEVGPETGAGGDEEYGGGEVEGLGEEVWLALFLRQWPRGGDVVYSKWMEIW